MQEEEEEDHCKGSQLLICISSEILFKYLNYYVKKKIEIFYLISEDLAIFRSRFLFH